MGLRLVCWDSLYVSWPANERVISSYLSGYRDLVTLFFGCFLVHYS